MGKMIPWYQQDINIIFENLGTSAHGISSEEASERLTKYGKNELPQNTPESILHILFRQINNPLIYVLLGSALLAISMGEITDGFVVAGGYNQCSHRLFPGVPFGSGNCCIKKNGSRQNNRLRDKKPTTIMASSLVPGDVVLLQAGDRIPADIRFSKQKGVKFWKPHLQENLFLQKKLLRP
jgi:Ca2+-transporting ATPase